MIIKTLAELAQPDEASLHFTPWGLGPKMRAEDAAEYQQKLIARYELSERIPETTRNSFERLRTIYSYGVLCYELYTVAADQARLVVEQALRDRFVLFYDGMVTFTDAQGADHPVTASKFDDVYRGIHQDGRLFKPKSWRLKLRGGHAPIRFDGMLTSLLRWARAEGLLGGQRDRMRDGPRVRLRNYAAHPGYHLETPVDAAGEIADLAAIINRLWGAPAGAPVRREIVAIAWTDTAVTSGLARYFSTAPLQGEPSCVIVRANPDDPELLQYDARYEATAYPCDYLWGPGTWQDGQAWLEREQPDGDEAQLLDRLFILRFHQKRLYLPQVPPIVAGLGDDQKDGIWYVIRADSPFDAFSHQRQILAGIPGHVSAGHCQCPADTLGRGGWQEALDLAAAAGVDVKPQIVPDVRVTMSHMPRWNEILGDGQWTVPPI